MPVRYEGPSGTEELIPAPLVTISKAYVRDQANNKLRPDYTFTLNGTIVNIGTSLDSPDASTDTMEGILAEQKRIRRLFSSDYGRLEIETPGGGGPNTIDAYCTVESVNFDQGVWVNRCNYNIVLKAVKIEGDNETVEELESKEEGWSITENDDGTYSISHTLSAVGVLITTASGNNDPISIARNWCRDRSVITSTTGTMGHYAIDSLNLTNLIRPMVSDSSGYWNLSVVEGVGIYNNSWQLTENFIHSPSGNTREEFSATVNYEDDDHRRLSVTANGSVMGLARRASDLTDRMANAITKFNTGIDPNIYTRLTAYVPTGYTLNPVARTKQITYEQNAGVIRYSHNFIASSGFLITGAIEENININDTAPTDIFAQIQVPGRVNGPVVQNMNTVTLPERTVSITATIANSGTQSTLANLASLYQQKPDTSDIVNALKPNRGYYYIKQDSEEWNPFRRQYSRTVSWTMQPEGQTVTGVPDGVDNNLSTN